jgi:amino acid adenylation domain-containing protein
MDGRAHLLPEPVPYRNHVAQALAHARKHDAEAFFRGRLSDIHEPTAPFGLLDVLGDGSRIEGARQSIDPALANSIRLQARRLNVSAATLFHAAWGLVLARTTSLDDVVFGSVLLGRLQGSAGAQRMLGMFINTLPLRLRLQGVTARELVEQTQRELMELLSHEQASLAVAQRCSGVVGSTPLFSTLLNYLHTETRVDCDFTGAAGVTMLASEGGTNYPLVVSVDDKGEGFAISVQTDRQLDPHCILGYMSTALRSLAEALEQAPQRLALTLSILPESERHQVVESFNATQADYAYGKCIHELFESQVERTPGSIAVVFESTSLTYRELNARANQLAHYLRREGVAPDCVVGICIERSLEMLIGLLGILKAGGAYVPLDPGFPKERLAYILKDACPILLLMQQSLVGTLPETVPSICLDGQWGILAVESEDNPERKAGADNLAYVIYTSGSTGQPKGVQIEHRGLCNLATSQAMFGVSAASRVLGFASLSFDAATFEWIMALLRGAAFHICTEAQRQDPAAIQALLIQRRITHATLPPALLPYLDSRVDHDLHGLVLAGEAFAGELAESWLLVCRVFNAYGPTECTVWASTAELQRGRPVRIGRPIPNAQLYVLDRWVQPVPVGVTGELHIGGVGLGRGYLNRPVLTSEKFIANPFGEAGSRLYKTGDLARVLPDGNIECLGRLDHQVKIRGMRIELGEIEAQLARHEHVRDVTVLAREDVPGEKRLVAYVSADPTRADGALTAEAMRAYLKVVLPDHMVPSAYVILERVPLSLNGKVDRNALPPPECGAYSTRQYENPRGELEEVLAAIWQQLLGVKQVGRQDNFFELGGHSLLGLKLTGRVAEQFMVNLSAIAVFRYPTIQQMARCIESLRPSHGEPPSREGAERTGMEFEEGVI